MRIIRRDAISFGFLESESSIDSIGALTDEHYWEVSRSFNSTPLIHEICPSWYQHVKDYLPISPESTCLEVGVLPGNVLLFFGIQLQYSCIGVDFLPEVLDLSKIFSARGVNTEFIQTDFLKWETEDKYDFVYSAGFIEHFQNYQTVIEKHWELVKPGGLLLLAVPTMTPAQKIFRLIFYKRSRLDDVKRSHNFEIMKLNILRTSVGCVPESMVLASGYSSEMEIWFGPSDPGIRKICAPLFEPLWFLEKMTRRTGISSRWYSPMAFVLAQKAFK